MEIVKNTYFDVNAFFRFGYQITSIDKPYADILLERIRSQNFFDANQERAGWSDPKVTHWEGDSLPSEFHHYWNHLSNSAYFSYFRENWGPFSQGLPMSNHFSVGNGMAWHADLNDGSFMTTMLYLTADEFRIEDGGFLTVGIKKGPMIVPLDLVLPSHGVLVTVNNLNPHFQHKVMPLVSDKERYTVMCHFGYVDPSLHSRSKTHTMFSTKGATLGRSSGKTR